MRNLVKLLNFTLYYLSSSLKINSNRYQFQIIKYLLLLKLSLSVKERNHLRRFKSILTSWIRIEDHQAMLIHINKKNREELFLLCN